MGYTGKLVTGVWVGRDDFRPVYRSGGRGLTGGSVPAQIWKSYMAVAHKSYDIPTLPGLSDHPAQIAERQRLAALRRENPSLNQENGEDQSTKLISTATLRVLEGLASSLRVASGVSADSTVGNLRDVIGRR
jgi:penicillin-binding protein 1A